MPKAIMRSSRMPSAAPWGAATAQARAGRLEEDGSEDAPSRHAARPTSSSSYVRRRPSRVPLTSAPEHGSRSRSRSRRQRRYQEHVGSSASEHGYHSPWRQVGASSVEGLLQQLTTLAECPFTEEFFRHSVDGATEHTKLDVRGRNITGLLYTMGGCLASLLRERFQQKPCSMELRNKVLGCAQHIRLKCALDFTGVTRLLYDFVLNRCDDAAVRILIDEALVCDAWTTWTNLSGLERDICLNALGLFYDNIRYEADKIKEKLLAARGRGAPEHD